VLDIFEVVDLCRPLLDVTRKFSVRFCLGSVCFLHICSCMLVAGPISNFVIGVPCSTLADVQFMFHFLLLLHSNTFLSEIDLTNSSLIESKS
jgi:hypothetical protein